jgi:hypothetical protein
VEISSRELGRICGLAEGHVRGALAGFARAAGSVAWGVRRLSWLSGRRLVGIVP